MIHDGSARTSLELHSNVEGEWRQGRATVPTVIEESWDRRAPGQRDLMNTYLSDELFFAPPV
jgi:hypothetical protein